MARKSKGLKPSISQWEDFTQDLGWIDPKLLFEIIKHVGVYVFDVETCGAGKDALDPRKGRLDGIAFYVPAGSPKDFGLLGYYDGKPVRAWFPFNDFSFMCHIRVRDIPELAPRLTPIGVNVDEIYATAENKDGTLKEPDELILVNLRPPMDQEETVEGLRPIWEELVDVIGITHHGKFDAGFLWVCPGTAHPIRVRNIWADSMLADFCSDERRKRYGLKIRVKQEFNHQMTPYAEAVRGQSLLAFCNAKPLGVYAMDDCYWEYRLHERSIEKLVEQEPPPANRTDLKWSTEQRFGRVMGRLEKVYWGVDTRVSEIIMEMEQTGVLIDWQHLQKIDGEIEEQKAKIWKRMESFLGWPLNPNATRQVADALFAPPPDGLGLPAKGIPIGKTGDPSTSDKVIKHFSRFHPLVADILKWRSLDTIQGGFVQKLIRLALEAPDGRIYAHFNQTRTVIARLSCISSESILSIRLGDENFRRSIKIAELGEYVGCCEILTHEGRYRKIKRLIKKGPGEMFRVETWDGRTLTCTNEHRFLTPDGWKALGELTVGSAVVVHLGELVSDDQFGVRTISSITSVGIEDVWDIEVEGDHSYVAHGFVNHNSSDPINLQNQPRDKDLVRKAYCSHREGIETDDPDLLLLGGDYGQIELRVAAHLSQEANMIEVYQMGGICGAVAGGPCERYTWHECKDCGACCPPVYKQNVTLCGKCESAKVEHQARCRHVDLHQRTADDAKVKRNPLAKCLDGSTLILPHGSWPRSIESVLGEIEPGEHQEIDPILVSTGEPDFNAVPTKTGLKRHRRPTKIVVTRRAIVVATEDHRFQVIGDYDSLDPDTPGYKHVPGYSLVEAQNLEKGMKLPLASCEGFDTLTPAWHKRSTPQEFRLNPFTKEPDPDGPASILLDEKWAYFAGVFAGDGCASGNSCTITHGSDDSYAEWRNTIREACDAVGLPNRVSGNKKHAVMGSRVVRRYFAGMELAEEAGTSGAKIMRIPSWVLAGGPKIAWSYLAGLFDADGTVDCVVSVTTKYPEFAGQVAFLLRWLGMPVSISPSWNKTYKRYYYTLSVLGEGLKRFLRYCPMRYTEKVEKLHARCDEIKREVAPKYDEVLLVLDGGERTVYDFQVESDDHLYLQGGLIGHNNLNFGLLYRMGAPKFCVYAELFDSDGMPMVDYAKEVIARWHAAYPAIAIFHEATEFNLTRNDWIAKTLFGRRRRLDQEARINRFRAVTQGIQFQVSGTSQDIMKTGMIRVWDAREAKIASARPAARALWKKFKFLMQIHDECVWEVPADIATEASVMVKSAMEGVGKGFLRVPLTFDTKVGTTWDDVH